MSTTTPDAPQTTAIVKPPLETFRDLLQKYRGNFVAVLPKTFSPERLIQVAMATMARDGKLLQCTPQSVLRALMIAAQLGLDPSGVLGEGYIVPYGKQATFILGYKGLRILASRGDVANAEARVVYERDVFEYELGTNQRLRHVPTLEDERGKEVCAYSIVHLRGATVPLIEVTPMSKVWKRRDTSRAGRAGPWVDWTEEMIRKTALRIGLAQAPISTEARRALAIEDRFETGETDLSDIIALPEMDEGAKFTDKSSELAHRLKGATGVSAGPALASAPQPPVSSPPPPQQLGGTPPAEAEAAAQEEGAATPPSPVPAPVAPADAPEIVLDPDQIVGPPPMSLTDLKNYVGANLQTLGMKTTQAKAALLMKIVNKPTLDTLTREEFEKVLRVTTAQVGGDTLAEALGKEGITEETR